MLLAIALSGHLAAMGMPQSAPDANSSREAQWKILYLAGAAPFSVDARINARLANGNLIFEAKKGATFFIPASAITAVSSNLTSEHTATRSQAEAWGALAQFNPYTLIFFPIGLPIMAATYPVKSKYAYVSILWSEKGTDQEVRLRLDRKDYGSFVAELQEASGKQWKNLETEWEKLRRELAGGSGRGTALQLDRKVRVGKVDLKPGLYQLVVLKSDPNHGEAYFFPTDQVNIEHLAGTALVDISPLSFDAHPAEVSYKEDEKGLVWLSDIRTGGELLHLR